MTMCGTPNYISPEVASRSSHGLEVDVWGLGCMLYTLLVGRPPFDTSEVKSTLTRVVMAKYELPSYLSAEAKDLIDLLLKKNPKERIKLDQIPEHPFLKLYSNTNAAPVSSRLSQDSGVHTMSIKRDSIRASVSSDCEARRLSNEICTRRVNSDCSPVRYRLQSSDNPYRNEHRRSRSQERLENYNSDHINEKFHNLKVDSVCSHEPSTHRPDQISLFSNPASVHEDRLADNVKYRLDQPKCQHSCCSLNCHRNTENSNVLDDLKPPVNNYPINDYMEPKTRRPESDVPPLCSFRLLPTRHRAKNAILTILDSGEVCVEIIKKRNFNQEVIKEVCLISPDGLRIVLFEPERGKAMRPGDKPPPLPAQGADAIFSYENLPEKHWKKYLYAVRFVDLVRAKTPKVTYYSPKSKFQLMENLKDYEASFYEGTCVILVFST